MGLRDILVHLDATDRGRTRLEIATALARRHDAHLAALCVVDVALPPGVLATGYASGVALARWTDDLREEELAAAAQAKQVFDAHIQREGISAEWRQVQGAMAETVGLHARYADLAIIGQGDPESPDGAGWDLLAEEVLFTSGRPVLIVPYAGGFPTVGRNVLVGWNASREAARAVNDALPLIAAADRTTVLAINPRRGLSGDGDVPAADIALHLARHGVNATAAHAVAEGIREGDVLLNHAADLGADLLVMGAYGHSRARELILGGATRSILDHATIPVLMSR